MKKNVWALPVVFASVIGSLPVQIVFAEQYSEPYPGLFGPGFSGTAQREGAVTVSFPVVKVDGRRVAIRELTRMWVSNHGRNLVESYFPRRQGDGQLPNNIRRWMRSNLEQVMVAEPRHLSVTWTQARFDLDSGRISESRTISAYHVDLGGEDE